VEAESLHVGRYISIARRTCMCIHIYIYVDTYLIYTYIHDIRFFGSVVSVKVLKELVNVKLRHYGPGHAFRGSRT
jgi:hypothetical protein